MNTNNIKYIIRIDDVCETMNFIVFDKIINTLNKYSIKPILAVVPKNEDKNLICNQIDNNFWNRIKKFQESGWAIGMHGYEHKYLTDSGGIMGINKFSEFAGLDIDIQRNKIAKAVSIFKEKNIKINMFIAPAHSFDRNTLIVLKENDINIISDGFFRYPVVDKNGLLWIPQQLWNFKVFFSGIWTTVIHINDWTEKDIKKFEKEISKYKKSIITFDEAIKNFKNNKMSLKDILFSYFYKLFIFSRSFLADCKKTFHKIFQ